MAWTHQHIEPNCLYIKSIRRYIQPEKHDTVYCLDSSNPMTSRLVYCVALWDYGGRNLDFNMDRIVMMREEYLKSAILLLESNIHRYFFLISISLSPPPPSLSLSLSLSLSYLNVLLPFLYVFHLI